MNDTIRNLNNTKSQKEALDNTLARELEILKNELYEKLNNMITGLKNHQNSQRSDALKLQQEISILKKEKADLQQKVTGKFPSLYKELQRRNADMEVTIGQDIEKRY